MLHPPNQNPCKYLSIFLGKRGIIIAGIKRVVTRIKEEDTRGACVAQPGGAADFGSGHDLMVHGFEPLHLVHCFQRRARFGSSVSLPLCPSLACILSLSLSLSQKYIKHLKQNKEDTWMVPGAYDYHYVQIAERKQSWHHTLFGTF